MIVLLFHLALFQHPVPAKVDTEMDHAEVQPQHGARAHDLAHGIGTLDPHVEDGPGGPMRKTLLLTSYKPFLPFLTITSLTLTTWPLPREEHPHAIPSVSIVSSFHLALFYHPVPAKVDTEMDHVEVQPQHGAPAHDLAHGIGTLDPHVEDGPGGPMRETLLPTSLSYIFLP